MPIYETREESGRMSIRLKSHQLAEQDIQDYGAIEHSDQELEARARYHIAQMQATLPTPQAVLAADRDAFVAMVVKYYPIIYKGLLVAYTGLKGPLKMTVEPRYTTSVNLTGTEDERVFTGLSGLLAIIKEAQDIRRKSAQEDACDAQEYLLTMVQVTIYDMREVTLKWYEKPHRFICYSLNGDQITGAYEQTEISNDILYGLGLPVAETIASTTSGNEV